MANNPNRVPLQNIISMNTNAFRQAIKAGIHYVDQLPTDKTVFDFTFKGEASKMRAAWDAHKAETTKQAPKKGRQVATVQKAALS
ncbi:MAG: hypothetical protein FWE31_04910, partial [Firmicutes bacterium]|nr:hypothetical protein [Bacillota bacterium]